MLGAFFSSTKDKEREAERVRRRDLVANWLASGRDVPGDLIEFAGEFRKRIPAFHWMIEFPEVFWVERPDPLNAGKRSGQAWIDGFIGNPPFMGVAFITEQLGDGYVSWLQSSHPGTQGKFDLSAHFFRRCADLLGHHGAMGLLATNTIAQGDTRATGLQSILSTGGVIYDAIRTLPWPGEAAVTVSVVHVACGLAAAGLRRRLDGAEVPSINSRLRAGSERADPVPLRANAGMSYVGSYVLGTGFVLTLDERRALLKKDARNSECILPYLGGKEVNSHPTQSFDRYVINLGDKTLEEASRWPDLLAILREKAKPERDQNNRDTYRKYWWQFGERQPALYPALGPLDSCLVTARVTKHLCFTLQPTDRVLHEKLIVFPTSSMAMLATLQSRIHAAWTWLLSSTMKTDLNYSASDCFATFPLPTSSALDALNSVGSQLYLTRAHYMATVWQGLTTTYNQIKDPDYAGELAPASAEAPKSPDRTTAPWSAPNALVGAVPSIAADPDLLEPDTRVAYIRHLRHLHEELDRAVLAAYGWSDVAVPPYCPPRPTDLAGLAAVSLFEDTIIDRLFALNAERAAEEAAAAGRPAPGKPAVATKPRTKRAKKPPSSQPSLLDEDS